MTTREAGAPGTGESGGGIRGRIRDFILASFYVADGRQLSDGTSLLESGVVDSTGVLEIIQFVEASFGFRVEDDEVVPENLDSVDHLVGYVSRKVRHA